MTAPSLVSQSYGKTQVRLSRVFRDGPRHEIIETTLSIALEGDFDAAYTQANNAPVVPTDTMKNTVYVLARRHAIRSIEGFGQLLAGHFLEQYAQVSQATVTCEQQPWSRMEFGGQAHDHAFLGATAQRYTCRVAARRGAVTTMTSGLAGLRVLKTTRSAFVDFYRDEYTTLPDAEDRIFATAIEAHWPCPRLDADWTAARQAIRAALLEVFANQDSKSVQHTLYAMAQSAFAACNAIDEISIRMPNQHHLLANLAPFDLDNPNEVFVPTSEPFGDIQATLRRGD
ncbi:MAG: urate oxidase [Planctomycetota bacterium]|nr:MAG: urate oxidase [Planctomycetota bacterium]